MIRTVARVIRGEGVLSALRRAGERAEESLGDAALLARGIFAGSAEFPLLNFSPARVAPRLGGVQTQLAARLHEERKTRPVALLHDGLLELSAPVPHARRVGSIDEALRITGAKAIHVEGTAGFPISTLLRLVNTGIELIVSVHDFSLFCARPHLLEEPMGRFCFYSQDLDRCHRCLTQSWEVPKSAQAEWRSLSRHLLTAATGVIFPSQFLADRHRELFLLPELPYEIRAPHPFASLPAPRGKGTGVAFAGSVKRHKGAHLLPEIVGDRECHVFGGGDEDILRDLRRVPNIKVHGYYRAGTLPLLLRKHGIGLVLLPSIVPEAFGLTLSEAWMAGCEAATFDIGALAERIRRDGGGFLAPLESGAAGLRAIVDVWLGAGAAGITVSRRF
jgi:glycosyltransferase involved in cell wall biosynthesis